MKSPRLALPLLALAVCAAAQPVKLPPPPASAPGKPVQSVEETSPAPVDSEGRYTGNMENLALAKECLPIRLYMENSVPERFYVGFVKSDQRPKLWFQNPASRDGKYPKPPDPDQLFCSRKPGLPPRDDAGQPFQIWNYPGQPSSKGLYAYAYQRSKKDGKATAGRVKPILWWGLRYGQELDELSDEKVADLISGKEPGGLGFKD